MSRAAAMLLALVVALLSCGAWSHPMTTYTGSDVFETSITLPDDAAPPTAAQVNPALEALADRTKWLELRTPAIVVPGVQFVTGSAGSSAFGAVGAFNSLTFSGVTLTFPPVLVGDIVTFEIGGSISMASDPSGNKCTVKLQDNQNGAGFVDMPGTKRDFETIITGGADAGGIVPVHIKGQRYISPAGGTYAVQVLGSAIANAACAFEGDVSFWITVYRPTVGL